MGILDRLRGGKMTPSSAKRRDEAEVEKVRPPLLLWRGGDVEELADYECISRPCSVCGRDVEVVLDPLRDVPVKDADLLMRGFKEFPKESLLIGGVCTMCGKCAHLTCVEARYMAGATGFACPTDVMQHPSLSPARQA